MRVSNILFYGSSLLGKYEGHEHRYAYHKDDSPENKCVIVARCGGLTVADVDKLEALGKVNGVSVCLGGDDELVIVGFTYGNGDIVYLFAIRYALNTVLDLGKRIFEGLSNVLRRIGKLKVCASADCIERQILTVLLGKKELKLIGAEDRKSVV